MSQDNPTVGDFSPAVDDLGIEPIARSLSRAREQQAIRWAGGEDTTFWQRRIATLERAHAQAQQQTRERSRARLIVATVIGHIARRVAPRPRGAGRPGARRVARASGGSDPPDGEHLDGRGRRP